MRTEILASIRGKKVNDQIEYKGQRGYWVQGQCVFIEASDSVQAINLYREAIKKAEIGVNHNHYCGTLKYFDELP